MKFGVREICNVVFRAKSNIKIGNTEFKVGQPVLYLDSAKTSTLEGAATTVYATGGRGNTRLVAWEGEKTLTFTVEDALISPLGFSILSGAGLLKGAENEYVNVHTTVNTVVDTNGVINLKDALGATEEICPNAPIFVMAIEGDGSLTGAMATASIKQIENRNIGLQIGDDDKAAYKNTTVMVDFYIKKKSAAVSEIQIDAENFAGYYYVEADTLFRRQIDGVDAPVNITLPNVKIQSNFSFSLASTGDPSTFTFTMDAFPGYTYFDNSRKVLCVMQIVEDSTAAEKSIHSVMGCQDADGNDLDTFMATDHEDSVVG